MARVDIGALAQEVIAENTILSASQALEKYPTGVTVVGIELRGTKEPFFVFKLKEGGGVCLSTGSKDLKRLVDKIMDHCTLDEANEYFKYKHLHLLFEKVRTSNGYAIKLRKWEEYLRTSMLDENGNEIDLETGEVVKVKSV